VTAQFSLRTDTQAPDLDTAVKVVYQWSYGPELEELRRLPGLPADTAAWVSSEID
jgi:hypothetical protein